MTNATGTFQPQGRAAPCSAPQESAAEVSAAGSSLSLLFFQARTHSCHREGGDRNLGLKCLHAFHAGAQQFKQLEGKERAAAENKLCLVRVSTAQYNQVM